MGFLNSFGNIVSGCLTNRVENGVVSPHFRLTQDNLEILRENSRLPGSVPLLTRQTDGEGP